MSLQQPLPATTALGRTSLLRAPQLLGDWLLWLEQRPHEKGRTTACIRRWGEPEATPLELTPAPINLRSRVHDYGGAPLTAALTEGTLQLVWVDDNDGCLWFQAWTGLDGDTPQALHALDSPQRLTAPRNSALGGGVIDPLRSRWLGVIEESGCDRLVSVALDQRDQPPVVVHQPADFAGYLALSADGAQLAWVEWQQPSMPWDCSQLVLARLTASGSIEACRGIAGAEPSEAQGISVFQPQWLPDGSLVVAEDSSGWWNLMRHPNADSMNIHWQRLWPMAKETAMPQWVFGMSTTAWDGEKLLAAVCDQGEWQLQRLGLDGSAERVEQPFNDLADLHASHGRAVAIASNSTTGHGLLELDLGSGTWRHTPAASAAMEVNAISVGQSLWFDGSGGQRTHAWYYPPVGGADASSPLLVKSHSGPSSMARRGLNLAIQFWTSRGWGVVDVNYGGSTGFGRTYRDRLQGGWGVVDVNDCAAAAKTLIATNRADPSRVAIEGGSAGGFTTLACLCFTDVFRAGACRYAVSDPSALATETHRFEARYLDGLIGRWPEERDLYEQRSPLGHADQIRCPVIFFQGLKDKVVLPQQTERMAEALRRNAIPVEVHTFPEEGHGFRDSAVQIAVLESTERFFRQHLNF